MTDKKTKNKYPLIKELEKRWSPRAYSEKVVEKEKLHTLFEAARWAPSASNLQPWNFIIGFKGDSTYDRIMKCLVEFNQLWAKTAPVLIISVAKIIDDSNKINKSYAYDLGQAVAHLSIQASSMGLFIHQMTGLNIEAMSLEFKIPVNFKIMTVFTVGYLGDANQLPPKLEKLEYGERIRKDFDEFIFSSTFGEKSNLF